MEHYYIGHIEIPSVLTKMETELSKTLRGMEYSVIAESELDKVVQELKDRQTEISIENPRLKQVDIKWSRFKYVSSNAGATIAIGRNQIQLIKINQFSGVFHEPNDPEGITSHELKHQMYGAKVQKGLDLVNAHKAFVELLRVQYGEFDVDESMHQYIDDALNKAMED